MEYHKCKCKAMFFSILLFVFTVCIFGPLELYLSNYNDFWFQFQDIIIGILITTIVIVAILLIPTILIPSRHIKFYSSVVFSLGVASYLQGNLMMVDYGLLDGREIAWSNYLPWGIVNTMIWLVCLILPIIVICKREKWFYSACKYISYFIVGVQAITLAVLLVTTPLNSRTNYYLSDSALYDLSNDENTLVFLLDGFDGAVSDEIFNTGNEFTNKFEDFTYYNNATSVYPTTRSSVGYLLTNQKYLNEQTYDNYITEAYRNNSLYDDMYNAGYNIQIYSDYPNFVSYEKNQIIENMVSENFKVSSYTKLNSMLYKFTGFKYLPHFLKRYCWLYSSDFNTLIETDLQGNSQPYIINDVEFYNNLLTQRVKMDSTKKTFKFFHLNGAHGPYVMNENMEQVDSSKSSEIKQAKGALNIVSEYLEQMKELNVYDNSNVIILADHGYRGFRQHIVFMVKSKHQTQPFEINSAPISMTDLNATLSLLTLGKNSGATVFDFDIQSNREREYYQVFWEGNGKQDYLSDITEMKIYGKASDLTKIKKTGNLYTSKGLKQIDSNKYKFGESILFNSTGRAGSIFDYGLNVPEEEYTWSQDYASEFSISLDGYVPGNDLCVTLNTYVLGGKDNTQTIIAYANDIKVHEQKYSAGENTIDIRVPAKDVKQDFVMRLEYPDAISPYSLGMNDDGRILAIAFHSLKIEQGSR